MPCPCGLSQDRVLEVAEKHGVPLLGGLCQNPFTKPDSSLGICGKPLGEHPLSQGGGWFPYLWRFLFGVQAQVGFPINAMGTTGVDASAGELANAGELVRSAVRMSFEKMVSKGKGKKKQVFIGNAVAISSTFAITALHGYVNEGHVITLHTSSGVKLKGTVVLNVYEAEAVDISVIALTEGGEFPCFTPVAIQPVSFLEVVYVAGLKINARDEAMVAVYESKVNVIERGENSALFLSSYVSVNSLSGAGVVVKQVGNAFRVIGVHVASHDNKNTTTTPPVTEAKQSAGSADHERVNLAVASPSSNIHGHFPYTMVCEIARVPSLISFLREKGLC